MMAEADRFVCVKRFSSVFCVMTCDARGRVLRRSRALEDRLQAEAVAEQWADYLVEHGHEVQLRRS